MANAEEKKKVLEEINNELKELSLESKTEAFSDLGKIAVGESITYKQVPSLIAEYKQAIEFNLKLFEMGKFFKKIITSQGIVKSKDLVPTSFKGVYGIINIKSAQNAIKAILDEGKFFIYLNNKYSGFIDFDNKTINDSKNKKIGRIERKTAYFTEILTYEKTITCPIFSDGEKICDLKVQSGFSDLLRWIFGKKVGTFENLSGNLSDEWKAFLISLAVFERIYIEFVNFKVSTRRSPFRRHEFHSHFNRM